MSEAITTCGDCGGVQVAGFSRPYDYKPERGRAILKQGYCMCLSTEVPEDPLRPGEMSYLSPESQRMYAGLAGLPEPQAEDGPEDVQMTQEIRAIENHEEAEGDE